MYVVYNGRIQRLYHSYVRVIDDKEKRVKSVKKRGIAAQIFKFSINLAKKRATKEPEWPQLER